ncbi:MAG: NF038104 family lipoprotein [Gammaproteobacteria bacterium]|nr:NF038104 family lipoprotein [Gammaproteobacteria bacterium]
MNKRLKLLSVVLVSLGLTACLGTVVGTAVDVTLEVAKVPFKVAGAVVDVATPEDDDEDEED